MTTQTDVLQSDDIAPIASAGYYTVNTLGGSPIQSCRVKEVVAAISGYSDGSAYGGTLSLYDGDPNNGGVLKLQLSFPGNKNTDFRTQSFLLPGQGILFRKSVWFYADGSNYNTHRIIYG